MKHTREQQILFLQSISHNLTDNPFIKMELRSRKMGIDLGVKKYLDQSEFPDISENKAKELLWTYVRAGDVKSENLYNALEGFNVAIESFQDSQLLIEQLNDYLEDLELPTFN